MKVSFCVTCMGRLHHLRETLPRNLEDNADCDGVEFVILDYNSPDALEEWARDELLPHFAGGRVVYYRERSAARFLMAHAKNVVHGLATGDVLCNLDADGFTGKGFATLLAETFRRDGTEIVAVLPELQHRGRLAVTREVFRSLRGYDEDFTAGWGYEDDDFLARAARRGLRSVILDPPGHSCIRHSHQDRVQYLPGRGNPRFSRHMHKLLSDYRMERGILVRNEGRMAGSAVVWRNLEEPPIQAGW